ncbi:outer membrane protein OmpU [Paraburkholderia sp. GV068]|nr:outer membrane protein OmpU [Paraburkholderia sp. GV072]PUA99774.1 outer membrane protein OmpU [Paraburkholderia sp. GV068]
MPHLDSNRRRHINPDMKTKMKVTQMKFGSRSVCRSFISVSIACLCTTAMAQSSVTLYGIINPGITYLTNASGNKDYLMVSGVTQPSRFGFLGSEDLGGGLKAVFRLENGFNVNDGTAGQGGRLFGRQAYVGLQHNLWGGLTIGYQYDFMRDDFVGVANGTSTFNGYAFKMGDADRIAGERLANSVKYVSPLLAGIQFGAMYSFGGVPGSITQNSAESFTVSYTASIAKVSAAYTTVRNATQAFGIGVDVFGKSANAQIFDRIDIVGLGVEANVASFDTHAIASLTDYKKNGQAAALRMLEFGVAKFVTPSITLSGGYNYYLINGAHFNEVSLGVDYLLSKRTDLALVYGFLRGSAGTNPQFYAAPAPSTSQTQQLVNISMRHSF